LLKPIFDEILTGIKFRLTLFENLLEMVEVK